MKKMKGRIINDLRRLHRNYWQPAKEIKKLAKVAPATYQCNTCQGLVYEGKAKDTPQSALDASVSLSKPLVRGKVYADHIEPVIPLKSFLRGSWDWDEYITRMFVELEAYQILCKVCHDAKTKEEKAERARNRKK